MQEKSRVKPKGVGSNPLGRFTWPIIILVVLLIIGYGVSTGGGQNPAASRKVGINVGDLAPNFTLPTLNGGRVTLWQLRGKPVWVNFWATWCPSCQQETSAIEKMYSQYGSRVTILGINATFEETSTNDVYTFAKRMGIHYPLLLDNSGAVLANYGVRVLPVSVFINAQGVIQAYIPGSLSENDMLTNLHQIGM